MKRFYCQCGNQVFFENQFCVSCDAKLGFCHESLEILSLIQLENGFYQAVDGREFKFCNNGEEYGVCNWLQSTNHSHPLCFACQFNRTIPNLQEEGNLKRWHHLEEGKKRLFFTLLSLKLPLVSGWTDPQKGLLFDFVADQRSEPFYEETFVSTGHLGGVITINTLEADEVARTAAKLEMNEPYRTVLGHLRHESGHYFWGLLYWGPVMQLEFEQLFGSEHRDYQQALEMYYSCGPVKDWREHYISAYGSAHPLEDWAETWGHYLHIYDVLETAAENGVISDWPSDMDIDTRVSVWRDMSITLNELNRSVGLGDAYPFVINQQVEEKLTFVHRVIDHLRTNG